MTNILKELYWGHLDPAAQGWTSKAQMRREGERLLELSDAFSAHLDKAAYEAYDALCDYQNGIEAEKSANRFVYAFKLGAQIMLEVLT